MDEKQELAEFANAGAQSNQPMPHGHALVQPTRALTPLGAQPVALRRDQTKIRAELRELAAMAGEDWFYRFPARSADGTQNWIEGASIKLANNVARVYGNCVTEVRELDVGDAFTFYARFTDLETGFSMERAFRQRKGQRTFKSKDADRQLDIVYQIGQSKAIRNVIVNALGIFCDFAFEQARDSIVEKIGKDLAGWRERTIEGFRRQQIDLRRVERVIGRASKDWLAPDIARIVAIMHAVADGMATVDESFPPDQTIEKAPTSDSAPANSAPDVAPTSPPDAEAAAGPTRPTEAPAATSQSAPKNFEEYVALVEATCSAATNADELKKWFTSDAQRRLRNACGLIAEDTGQLRGLVTTRMEQLARK